MHAVVVTLTNAEPMELLASRLQQAYGQVACYQRGRRVAGGMVHLGEGLLRRQHPEYLMQAASLLMLVPAALLFDLMDSVLSSVARLDDPAMARVQVLDLQKRGERALVGSAGE